MSLLCILHPEILKCVRQIFHIFADELTRIAHFLYWQEEMWRNNFTTRKIVNALFMYYPRFCSIYLRHVRKTSGLYADRVRLFTPFDSYDHLAEKEKTYATKFTLPGQRGKNGWKLPAKFVKTCMHFCKGRSSYDKLLDTYTAHFSKTILSTKQTIQMLIQLDAPVNFDTLQAENKYL